MKKIALMSFGFAFLTSMSALTAATVSATEMSTIAPKTPSAIVRVYDDERRHRCERVRHECRERHHEHEHEYRRCVERQHCEP